LVPEAQNVISKPMFGHVAAFVNGTMFMGVFGDRVLVRLGATDRAKLLQEEGAGPFEPMAGRPMKEYVLLPPNWQDEPAQARAWVKRSLAYASALPPKKTKAPTRKAPKKKAAPTGARAQKPAARAKAARKR
jgi:TfoX/Sxy family transcriptional regulator of competence genes